MRNLFRGAIIGAPGSGKGTLSARIVKNFDIYHLSTGDLFRKTIVSGGDLGKKLDRYVSKGQLVPDDLTIEVASTRLREIGDRHWLLDGFPRTLVQAEKLFLLYPLNLVISLKVPYSVILERVKDRWIHPSSGRIYHSSYSPPRIPGKDDVTGEPLIQRPDDNPGAVLSRLELYMDTMSPLIEFYRKKKVLKEIAGNTSDQLWPLTEKEILRFVPLKSLVK